MVQEIIVSGSLTLLMEIAGIVCLFKNVIDLNR